MAKKKSSAGYPRWIEPTAVADGFWEMDEKGTRMFALPDFQDHCSHSMMDVTRSPMCAWCGKDLREDATNVIQLDERRTK